MTLDFKKMVRNWVKKQMSIQHYSCNVQLFRREELPPNVTKKIQSDYGENSIADADYMLFFSGTQLTREVAQKTLFNIVNSALGNSANDLNPSDLKFFEYDAKAEAPEEKQEQEPEAPAEDADGDSGVDEKAVTDNADAVADALGESVEAPVAGEKFVFVKITMK